MMRFFDLVFNHLYMEEPAGVCGLYSVVVFLHHNQPLP